MSVVVRNVLLAIALMGLAQVGFAFEDEGAKDTEKVAAPKKGYTYHVYPGIVTNLDDGYVQVKVDIMVSSDKMVLLLDEHKDLVRATLVNFISAHNKRDFRKTTVRVTKLKEGAYAALANSFEEYELKIEMEEVVFLGVITE